MMTARVIYHYEDGSWWAESPDVPRWSAAGETFNEVRKLAEEGIPFATQEEDWNLRHLVPGELLPYFGAAVGAGATAGAISRVRLAPLAGVHVVAEPLPAGVDQEHSVA
jgi:predicted RNase H-like HicB family nuclease